MAPVFLLLARRGDDSQSDTPVLSTADDMSGHSGHSTGGTTTGTASNLMNMAFHTTTTDNLFSESWAPKTIGQYAGACIFLIVLAIIHRFLVAFKSVQDAKWHAKEQARVIVVGARGGEQSSDRNSMEGENNDPKSDVAAVTTARDAQGSPWTSPWRFSTEVPRAGLSTVTSGVGYLLYVYLTILSTIKPLRD